MALPITEQDYKFMLLTEQFCQKVDKYAATLKLDKQSIDEFKYDAELLSFVCHNSNRYSSCVESFKRYKIESLRNNFSRLLEICKSSKKYTVSIGEDLGIEPRMFALKNNNQA